MTQARSNGPITLSIDELIKPTMNAEQASLLQSFLRGEQVVRILIQDGINSGDFMASVFIYKRLIELGFNGWVEFVHDIYGSGNNLENGSNLQQIFGLPSEVSDYHEDSARKLRFINLTKFIELRKNNQVEACSLGLTGRFFENPCEALPDEGFNVINLEDPLCLNPADLLNVKTYISIDNWPTPNKLLLSKIVLSNHENVYSLDCSTTYFGSHKNTIDIKTYIQEYKKSIPHHRFLNDLTDRILTDQINFMPTYGKYLKQQFAGNPHIYNMLQLVCGVAYAKSVKKTAISKKPTVIGIFYDYEVEGKEFVQFIKHPDEKIESIKNTITSLHLEQNFSYARWDDPHISALLDSLQSDNIVLLALGPQLEPVFNWFFTYQHQNMLLSVREGSSSGAILFNTGKSQLRCGGNNVGNKYGKWEFSLDTPEDTVGDEVLFKQLRNIYSERAGFCDDQWTWQDNPELYKQLGDLIIAADTPDSTFVRYFREIEKETSKIENDRIAVSIVTAMEIADFKPKPHALHNLMSGINEVPDLLFDSSEWDNVPTYDWYTKKPIFTYRLYNKDKEVGSIEFYGVPGLCVSKVDAQSRQHNIIKTTGIVTSFELRDDMLVETICELLPPSLFDKVVIASRRAAIHGSISAGAEVLGVTLQTRGMSPQLSHYFSNFVLYGSVFMIKYHEYSNLLNTLDREHDALRAFYLAAIETGQLMFVNLALEATSNLLQKISKCFSSSTRIQSCSKLLPSAGLFAYYGYDNLVTATASVAAGIATNSLTKYTMKKLSQCLFTPKKTEKSHSVATYSIDSFQKLHEN